MLSHTPPEMAKVELMGGEGIAYGGGLLLGSLFIGGAIGYVIGLVRSRSSN